MPPLFTLPKLGRCIPLSASWMQRLGSLRDGDGIATLGSRHGHAVHVDHAGACELRVVDAAPPEAHHHAPTRAPVSYTHLRAHETEADL
eukprot:2914241-Rhodomonas_salina.1